MICLSRPFFFFFFFGLGIRSPIVVVAEEEKAREQREGDLVLKVTSLRRLPDLERVVPKSFPVWAEMPDPRKVVANFVLLLLMKLDLRHVAANLMLLRCRVDSSCRNAFSSGLVHLDLADDWV